MLAAIFSHKFSGMHICMKTRENLSHSVSHPRAEVGKSVSSIAESVTSRKALDDTEGIRIKSEFSKQPLTRFASGLIQSMTQRCASKYLSHSACSTVLPTSGPYRELAFL